MKKIRVADIEVIDLGIKENDVYDIEVKDTHCFYANGILVHNSNFLDLSGVASMIENKLGKKTDAEMIDLIAKFADNQLGDASAKICKELGTRLNMLNNYLSFKREKVIPSMVYIAKKRYIAMVGDSEGVRYATPELSCTGVETNRSSTPKLIRGSLEDSFKILLTQDVETLRKFVAKAKEEFYNASIEEISFPRGVNGVAKYDARKDERGRVVETNDIYKKGCPQHVRAALMYNYMIKKHKLDTKYPLIKEGDKIKFIQLEKQNPTREDVIAFKEAWPKELNLDKYVDKETQFNKSFLDPLVSILEKANWQLEETGSLDEFF